jgi:hypothetical protein
MPRGGRRQGTPGKAYSNRTDLGVDYSSGSPASGGIVTNPQPTPTAPQAPGQAPMAPEDTPGLLDPTQRPGEPITAGLVTGEGPGPAGGNAQMAGEEIGQFKPWLPLLQKAANSPSASPSFVRFVRYLRDF